MSLSRSGWLYRTPRPLSSERPAGPKSLSSPSRLAVLLTSTFHLQKIFACLCLLTRRNAHHRNMRAIQAIDACAMCSECPCARSCCPRSGLQGVRSSRRTRYPPPPLVYLRFSTEFLPEIQRSNPTDRVRNRKPLTGPPFGLTITGNAPNPVCDLKSPANQ